MQSIKETVLAGGKVFIPAFAVGRAQEVLFILDDYMNSGLLPKAPIYVDGMINKAMRIYRHNVIYCREELQKRILMSDYDPFRSPNFVPIEKKGMRLAVMKKKEGCIIVTTSGMMTGGPIISYLSKLGRERSNKLLIVGYQAVGTPGRAIQDGAKEVKVEKTTLHISLPIETYRLTAHADRRQLDMLVGRIRGLRNVFVVHGEAEKLIEFRDDLSRKYNAVVPKIGVEYHI
jgi:predicted metal-dependent RNase